MRKMLYTTPATCGGIRSAAGYENFVMGRTPTEPTRAPGFMPAIAIASSISLASTSQNPPSCSLISANRLPVINDFASRIRTIAASLAGF
jgi:hypothetical protein